MTTPVANAPTLTAKAYAAPVSKSGSAPSNFSSALRDVARKLAPRAPRGETGPSQSTSSKKLPNTRAPRGPHGRRPPRVIPL